MYVDGDDRIHGPAGVDAIRSCGCAVGRAACAEALPPEALLTASAAADGAAVTRHATKGDPVLLAVLPGGGGLLTFVKAEHTAEQRFVHTLNTASGLVRKLESLGISVAGVTCAGSAYGASVSK